LLTGTTAESLKALKESIPLVEPEPANIDKWVQLAKDQNLDLVTARLAKESAGIRVRAERGAKYPTLDLLAIGSSSTTGQRGRRDIDAGELRLELRMPLYTGGRINAQVARAKSEVTSAEATLQVQELATAQRTRDAYRGVV